MLKQIFGKRHSPLKMLTMEVIRVIMNKWQKAIFQKLLKTQSLHAMEHLASREKNM